MMHPWPKTFNTHLAELDILEHELSGLQQQTASHAAGALSDAERHERCCKQINNHHDHVLMMAGASTQCRGFDQLF
jgi:hypothetical protein